MKAFPSHGTMGEVVQEGMDLRDYFASDAMKGLIAAGKPFDFAVQSAYVIADMMMEARK
jgi:hypothetical protein